MIENRLIVCIASAWDYDPTSKHQIMRILSRGNDILWVNYHGTRRPVLSRTDLRDAWSAVRRAARGARRISPSMVQLTPLVVPGASGRLLSRIHRRLLVGQIRRALQSLSPGGCRPVQIWSFAPDVPFLCGAFGEECFVYYCVDEYAHFAGLNARRIAAAEERLLDSADVVVAASEPLWQTKRRRRPDAILVRHGVDYEHFASAWRSPPAPPDDLTGIARPIFGFFGLIHHWVDVALLSEVARLRPQYSFVLLGDCKVNVSDLSRLPNVHLLGRRPYETLPAYCAAFDAGLMFFARSALTRNVNPIKMMEYLAAGLPVVSTPLPEAERYPAAVAVAETPESFARACDAALTSNHPQRHEAISGIVREETWLSRAELISQHVMGAVARRGSVLATRREALPSPLEATRAFPARS